VLQAEPRQLENPVTLQGGTLLHIIVTNFPFLPFVVLYALVN